MRLFPVVLMLALICAAGCDSSNGLADGPLGPPQNNVTQCTPTLKAGRPITIGLVGVQNRGNQSLVIDRVTLAKPRKGAGLGLAGWGVIPGNSELGVIQYWPARGQRLKVVDRYRVKPRQWVDVVVGVTAYGRGGFSPGALVHYHSGGTRYVFRSTVAMQVVVAGISRCRI